MITISSLTFYSAIILIVVLFIAWLVTSAKLYAYKLIAKKEAIWAHIAHETLPIRITSKIDEAATEMASKMEIQIGIERRKKK